MWLHLFNKKAVMFCILHHQFHYCCTFCKLQVCFAVVVVLIQIVKSSCRLSYLMKTKDSYGLMCIPILCEHFVSTSFIIPAALVPYLYCFHNIFCVVISSSTPLLYQSSFICVRSLCHKRPIYPLYPNTFGFFLLIFKEKQKTSTSR